MDLKHNISNAKAFRLYANVDKMPTQSFLDATSQELTEFLGHQSILCNILLAVP